VFNLQEGREKQVVLNLDEISARCRGWDQPAAAPAGYLLWDFWGREMVETDGHELRLPMPEKSCRVFALRKRLARPQLLGTSGHFSQGALETSGVTWDARRQRLSGRVRGNGGDPTTLYFRAPPGLQLSAGTLDGQPEPVHPLTTTVLALDVGALDRPAPFALSFEGDVPEAEEERPFVAGPAARIIVE
jgi:hypothetical protein